MIWGWMGHRGRSATIDWAPLSPPALPFSRAQSFVSDKLPVALVREDDCERTVAHTGTRVTNYPDKDATAILAAR